MKLIKTTLLLTTLSLGLMANSPEVIEVPSQENTINKNFKKKQEKRVKHITKRIQNITERKECMNNSLSLTQMQKCRIKKNKNKPFKLKKGMTFKMKKDKKIKKMNLRIDFLNKKITCIKNSNDIDEVKTCQQKKLKPIKATTKPLFQY